MAADGERGAARLARDEAVSQVVGTVCYVAVIAAISWGVTHRYLLERACRTVRARWAARHADPYAREMAEFRREIADVSRGGPGPAAGRERGLYEREA